jgi:hypothetical protein
MDKIEIRCPKCGWEPDGKPHWYCTCGMNWDTFSTGARCPRCAKLWSYTQCPRKPGGCGGRSPHLDWYCGLDDVLNRLKEEIRESWELPV